MAYQLLVNNLGGGASQQVIPLLAAFQKFAALTAPVTTEDMRVAMELDQLVPAGQARTYTDAEWLAFLTSLASIGFTDAQLNVAELTVINTIRQAVNLPPSTKCCGSVTPAQGDGLTALQGFAAPNSVTFEHEIRLILDKSLTCDIKTVQIKLTPVGLAPPPTVSDHIVLFNKCDSQTENSLYSDFGVTFAGNPSGLSYSLIYTFKDANGILISAYIVSYNLTL
jgi:hypothetical protein